MKIVLIAHTGKINNHYLLEIHAQSYYNYIHVSPIIISIIIISVTELNCNVSYILIYGVTQVCKQLEAFTWSPILTMQEDQLRATLAACSADKFAHTKLNCIMSY